MKSLAIYTALIASFCLAILGHGILACGAVVLATLLATVFGKASA